MCDRPWCPRCRGISLARRNQRVNFDLEVFLVATLRVVREQVGRFLTVRIQSLIVYLLVYKGTVQNLEGLKHDIPSALKISLSLSESRSGVRSLSSFIFDSHSIVYILLRDSILGE